MSVKQLTRKERVSLLRQKGWKRVASVTPGGKPHFYFRRDKNTVQWICWDRKLQTWQVETKKGFPE